MRADSHEQHPHRAIEPASANAVAAARPDPLEGARAFVVLTDAEELLGGDDVLLAYADAMGGLRFVTLAIDASRLPIEAAGRDLKALVERCGLSNRDDVDLVAVMGPWDAAKRNRMFSGTQALYRRNKGELSDLPVFNPESLGRLRDFAQSSALVCSEAANQPLRSITENGAEALEEVRVSVARGVEQKEVSVNDLRQTVAGCVPSRSRHLKAGAHHLYEAPSGSPSQTRNGVNDKAAGGRTLLVNYWFAHPVGHAIEAMRYALGYQAADPSLCVSLLLSGATPVELAEGCRFLDTVYGVPFTSFAEVVGDPAAALADVPRAWDYVVDNFRAHCPDHEQFAGFRAFFNASWQHFEPRVGSGMTPPFWVSPRTVRSGAGDLATTPMAPSPAYVPHQQLRLEVPNDAREAAARTIGHRPQAISVVLAGSSSERHRYPSAASWELILTELARCNPDSALCLIGKLNDDGRTTSRLFRGDVERLLRNVPRTIDCFDRPLWEQVAVIEASSLLVAPHTGFAFVASTVDTPWLAISGGEWHEYFFNGVPVYSVLPDTGRYPCFAWAELGNAPLSVIAADLDGEGPRTPSMCAARIREDLPEILHAADLLLGQELTYEEALADYFPRLLVAYGGDVSRIFTFDDVHKQYLARAPL
jgi:hypothetical protein